MRIVTLGDSHAFGMGNQIPGAVNLGIVGNQLMNPRPGESLDLRIEKIQRDDLVLLSIGGNDLMARVPFDAKFETQLTAAIAAIHAREAQVVLVGLSPTEYKPLTTDTVVEFRPTAPLIAKANQLTRKLDALYRRVTQATGARYYETPIELNHYRADDLIHYTALGYNKLALGALSGNIHPDTRSQYMAAGESMMMPLVADNRLAATPPEYYRGTYAPVSSDLPPDATAS